MGDFRDRAKLRDLAPQRVEQARRQWNDRFDSALARSREIFRRQLIDRGYDPDKLSDDEVAEIIKNASSLAENRLNF